MWFSARNGFRTFQPPSSIETPTTAKPWGPYAFWNSENHGISFLHPVHHVAQKSRRTILPRYSASFMVWPELSCNANSGAALRSFAGCSGARVPDESAAKTMLASASSIDKTFMCFYPFLPVMHDCGGQQVHNWPVHEDMQEFSWPATQK